MAYGFRHIPARRTAYDGPPLCPSCAARLDIGPAVHLCKEWCFGTLPSPLLFIPFEPPHTGDDPGD